MSPPDEASPNGDLLDADELSFNMAEPTNRVSLQRRSSLFGLGNSGASKSPPRKSYKSDYSDQLTTEAQQWHRLVKNLMRHNASIANNHLQVTVADQNIEQRIYITAAPDFEKFQKEAVAFAKLAEFFAFRMDDIRERREALRYRVECDLKESIYNMAIKHRIVMPPFTP